MKDVSIYGAGLAGLVAAINLAREGLNVTVYEREDEIGGSKDLHPSVHSTPMQPKETWDYIGVDLSSHFVKTDAYFQIAAALRNPRGGGGGGMIAVVLQSS
ncbi:FAD-dependent oxidoreductase [Desulfatibacillum aliphaticivorans]|uniref:FAD-dependent oxidoreductase n=1 Tax=Desulfatibacillum aliphaticivorans TaxID=218208 RepID=UPI000418B250|nr:FAD-dependent oxidoreductase [Desulfatibacillum aliphaticivorans]